jgi:hypothetical protein
MITFNITYDVVTHESAERGDFAEIGFVAPGGREIPVGDCDLQDKLTLAWDLRSAVRTMGICENSGHWFTEADGRVDYRTGAVTRYSLHPPKNITEASYGRLYRLLNGEG